MPHEILKAACVLRTVVLVDGALESKSLGELVLGDGTTVLLADPNRIPFQTVRTPQASLAQEKLSSG